MLDIKFIRENREQVEQAAKNKNIELDFDALLELDKERIKLLQEVEEFKSMKNSLNDLIKQAKSEQERNEIIEKGKEIKTKLEIKEPQLRKVMDEFEALMVRVPNVVSPDTPIGKSDASRPNFLSNRKTISSSERIWIFWIWKKERRSRVTADIM